MDAERQDDGHWNFRLGPVERVVIGAALVSFLGVLGWIGRSFTERLDSQKATLDKLVTQQAVDSAQLAALSTQLANVPNLMREIAELRVRVDNHDEAIRDLRQRRGAP